MTVAAGRAKKILAQYAQRVLVLTSGRMGSAA
jgi:hypothetical protein